MRSSFYYHPSLFFFQFNIDIRQKTNSLCIITMTYTQSLARLLVILLTNAAYICKYMHVDMHTVGSCIDNMQ